MDFPSTSALIRYHNLALCLPPLFLCVGLGMCTYFISILRRRPLEFLDMRLPIIGGCMVLISLVLLCITLDTINNALQFRIDPTQVTAIRIERMGYENERPIGQPVVLSDSASLLAGLQALPACTNRLRNHEGFSDGYRLQLKFGAEETFSNLYLSIYRRSYGPTPVTVVIPHIGPEHIGSINNGGEYSCPAFHSWVEQRIDPLFAP